MKSFSLKDVEYLNVEILKKIRYKIQKKIYNSSGKERMNHEIDHAYLSNYITRLENSAKIHKRKYPSTQKKRLR